MTDAECAPSWTARVLPSGIAGSRRCLLFHGWGQTGAYWIPVARWLPREVELAWVRLGGVVRQVSGLPGSMERTEQIVARVGSEGPTPEMVVGHSAGAVTALCAAATWPTVRALCLVEPLLSHLNPAAAGGKSRGAPSAMAVADGATEEALTSAYPLAEARTIATIAAALAADAHAPDPMTSLRPPRGDTSDRAARIRELIGDMTVPVTLIRGAASSYCRAGDLDTIAAAFHRAPVTITTIDAAGHSPHVDQPCAVASAMAAALGLGAVA